MIARPVLKSVRSNVAACGALSLAFFIVVNPFGCGFSDRPDQELFAHNQNLILITVDTLRADHLGCYGYPGAFSPNIDRLADHAVLFEKAYSTAPHTGPSHASILTSRHPSAHGVLYNGHNSDIMSAGDCTTLAEHLGDMGFETMAVVSSGPLDASYGFSRGFDGYRRVTKTDHEDKGGASIYVHQEAMNWLRERDPDRRFFLWLHFFEPHMPYVSASDISEELNFFPDIVPSHQTARQVSTEVLKQAYRSEIYEVDRHIGTFLHGLESLGLAEDTIVALTADHGEYLGEHSSIDHSKLYDEVLHVPMMIHWSGFDVANRRADPVSTVDLVPTVLDLLQVPDLEGAQGQSRLEEAVDQSPVFAEWRHFRLLEEKNQPRRGDFLVSVQIGSKKLIRDVLFDDATLLLDLQDDPDELEDLRGVDGRLFNHLSMILDAHILDDLPKGLQSGVDHIQVSKESEEMLRELGYIE